MHYLDNTMKSKRYVHKQPVHTHIRAHCLYLEMYNKIENEHPRFIVSIHCFALGL